jgi:pyruvate dehydrogenase E1 component subunit alpha
MARTVIFRGEIPFLQVLDEQGRADAQALPEIGSAQLWEMYEWMQLTRLFDERAYLLQREGRLGTYAQSLGQEAAQVGSALALGPSDWVVPSYRENGVLLCRGIPMQNILLFWGGDERGMLGFRERHCLPFAVPVGTQVPHAVGLAMAAKLRGERAVVACYFGDGATSTGDCHEGLTMAGTFKTPVVFVCQNNQWAISVPRARQCGAETFAQKALAYGIDGIQVDGNDVLACYSAAAAAIARARRGEGATLIEAFTYRLGDHTTADDASRYRDPAEVEAWKQRDPLQRLRRYLEETGQWNAQREADLLADCRRRVDAAVTAAESLSPPDPADIVRYTYANPPRRPGRQPATLAEQAASPEASEPPAARLSTGH